MMHPAQVGSVIPSSRYLAEAVVEAAGVREADTVVEFGPGSGAITEAILPRLKPGATFFAMEVNPKFVAILRERFPAVCVHEDSAAKTPEYLRDLGKSSCDTIVSGLPWTCFPETLQDELLGAAVDALRPEGLFTTYTYLQSQLTPGAKRFRDKLDERFEQVDTSPTVWLNVPPAFVYRARKNGQ